MNRSVPFSLGTIHGRLFGGPFHEFTPRRRIFSVCMKVEPAACDIQCPTEDFSVPTVSDMNSALKASITALSNGNDIFVGCAGGLGRTGIFMSCMVRVMQECGETLGPYKDAISYVRGHYDARAVETAAQEDWVNKFPVAEAVKHAKSMQSVPIADLLRARETIHRLDQDMQELFVRLRKLEAVERKVKAFLSRHPVVRLWMAYRGKVE